jgi:hypothetical protein
MKRIIMKILFTTILFGILLILAISMLQAAPMPGQIIVDPDHPEWCVYNRDSNGDSKLDPHFTCGPGDPEDFFYRGTRNADGTRTGDQMTVLNKLIGTGANCIYIQSIRSHGGDGSGDHNPFEGSNPSNQLDNDILDQWETWITHMDTNGIVLYFFFYDDAINVSSTIGWPLSGNNLHSQEQYFIQTIVNRFEHHKNLIWIVMEEVQEMGSDHIAHASAIAAAIRAADDYDHVIGCHQLSGLSFLFANDPNMDQFAIQYNGQNAPGLHSGMVTAWNNAAGRYGLNMSEAAGHGTGSAARLKNWASAMGGAYVMILGMDIASTTMSDLQDCGRQARFFESTNFNEMAPHDELANGGTDYVLAYPGQSYIAYASNLSGNMGLKGMTAGTYDFKWFDPVDGDSVVQTGVSVGAGDQSWAKPSGIGAEVALYVNKTGGVGNATPTANAQNVTAIQNTPKQITLTYSDPDGPGPYTFSIVQQPANGQLSGSDSVRTYTPDTDYTGPDSFSFTVSDGQAASSAALVRITVEDTVNDAPAVIDQTISTIINQAGGVSLGYSDPDGPGPYTIEIIAGPYSGTAQNVGNDLTYTPDSDFTGADSFTWRVSDSLAWSDTATVRITVSAPSETLRIEAESMTLSTYTTESNAAASGNSMISLKGGPALETGTATISFPGANGTYDVIVAYFDENDGVAHLEVSIGGTQVDAWDMDQDLGGTGASAQTLVRRTVATDLSVSAGGQIQITGTETDLEHARVDYVEFIRKGPVVDRQGAMFIPSEPGLNVFPNPFRPLMKIALNDNSRILDHVLQVFDISGKLVKDFQRETPVLASPFRLIYIWDSLNHSAGFYLVRAMIGDKVFSRKVFLVK